MIYSGKAFQCEKLEGDFVELRFDLKDDSVNKFNAVSLGELREAISAIGAQPVVKGVLMTSAKDVFIVGADITEFLTIFKKPESELVTWLLEINRVFSALEDLDCPSVAAINGFALGGGMEYVLAASYRVMSDQARVGLPETKLGIYPGWGGTVRLPRLIGVDNAIEWIASGEQYRPEDALKVGAVDAVVAGPKLREAALTMLREAAAGKLDWKARRHEKMAPMRLNPIESAMAFETSLAFVGAKAGPNYPAPVAAIETMKHGVKFTRDDALKVEAEGFAKLAKLPVTASLVNLFLGDQYLKKVSKKAAKDAPKIEAAAVLGAGIMGGGIAYVSASKAVPIYMKDIAPAAIELGLGEAIKLLTKQVERGKMKPDKMAATMARIRPTLSYGDFKNVDIVVEAVVENEKVKKSVLAELEGAVKEGTVLTSNTSTISITRLAEGLKHPENFCGMHFFNPVPKMPLVEVIRGAKTNDRAIAATVSYALGMGKTPIVVNDCAGFYVNRVLFPYFGGFSKLVMDGVDFKRIDKVMEKFGWPMGPAYLLDVVGIDTGHHADAVMAAAFPDRMNLGAKTPIDVMYENKRFGQKNGIGFYKYVPDKKGPPKKELDPSSYDLLKSVQTGKAVEVSDEEIVDRMMLPMILEVSRCLEEKIIASPIEADLGLIYGLGFPPFRGGALRYADQVGTKELLAKTQKYSSLGGLYKPTKQLETLAKEGKGFHA